MRWMIELPQVCCARCHANLTATEWNRLRAVSLTVVVAKGGSHGGAAAELAQKECPECGNLIKNAPRLLPNVIPAETYRTIWPDGSRRHALRPRPEGWWERFKMWLGCKPSPPPWLR